MNQYEVAACRIAVVAVLCMLALALLGSCLPPVVAGGQADPLACLLAGGAGDVTRAVLSDYQIATFVRLDADDLAALRAVPVVGQARAVYDADPHWEAGGQALQLLPGWDVWLDRAGVVNRDPVTGWPVRMDGYLQVTPLAGRGDVVLAVAADVRLVDAAGDWHCCAAALLDAAAWQAWRASLDGVGSN